MGKTATFEVGADLSFFANRLNTNLTYYNRLTSDKYAALSFPTSTGFSSVTNNNGEFRNQGIEIELSGKLSTAKIGHGAPQEISHSTRIKSFHYRTMVWKETVSMHSKYIPETEMRKMGRRTTGRSRTGHTVFIPSRWHLPLIR